MVRILENRRILITGASGGLGEAIAAAMCRKGARALLTARSADKLNEQVRKLTAAGGQATAFAADVTAAAERQRLLENIADRFGGLDILINNAGVASFGHFSCGTEAILRRVMEVNFFGPAELIRAAVPLLQQGQQPAIVNVASMCGRYGLPAWSEYSASKFALVGLTEALRGELVRFGIDVLLVVPGLMNTGLGRHLLRNEGRMPLDYTKGMPPEEVARSLLAALAANRRETVLGSEARWLLRASRFFPGLVNRLMIRKVAQLYARS